jgi:hypothetical protein
MPMFSRLLTALAVADVSLFVLISKLIFTAKPNEKSRITFEW